jgi:hypothetical protein
MMDTEFEEDADAAPREYVIEEKKLLSPNTVESSFVTVLFEQRSTRDVYG